MTISKEQAIAELKRRGVNISKEQALSELKRRGVKVPENKGESKGFTGIGEDVLSGIKQFPEAVGGMLSQLPEEAYGAGKQLLTDPRRVLRNALAGTARMGHGVLNTPANIVDYLAGKEVIPKEYKGKVPRQQEHDFSDLASKAFESVQLPVEPGTQAGDVLLQGIPELAPYLLPGGGLKGAGAKLAAESAGLGAHAIGQNENPFPGALIPGAARGAAKGIGGGINLAKKIPSVPESFVSKYFGGNLPLEEILKNLKSTEGVPTSLGRILGSPSLTKFQENMLNEVPFGGGEKFLTETAKSITEKGKELITDLGNGRPISSPNETIHQILKDAKEKQNTIKNELYKPVNELAKKENFQLELPNTVKLAQENIDAIMDSPLYKNNNKFRKAANRIFGVTKTSEEIPSVIVDKHGKSLVSKTNRSSIVDARVIANDLYDAGEQLKKNPAGIDQSQGKLFTRIANRMKKEINREIENKGSEALKKANEEASKNYKSKYLPFLDKEVHKLLNTGELSENFVRDVIRPGKQTDKAARINKIKELLPEKDKSLLGQAYLSDVIDAEGNLDPRAFLKKFNSLGPRQKKALFDAHSLEKLNNYERLIKLNPEALNAMFNPKTGARNTSFLSTLFPIISGSGKGSALGVPAAAAIQSLGARRLNKMLYSPEFAQKVINKKIASESLKSKK